MTMLMHVLVSTGVAAMLASYDSQFEPSTRTAFSGIDHLGKGGWMRREE